MTNGDMECYWGDDVLIPFTSPLGAHPLLKSKKYGFVIEMPLGYPRRNAMVEKQIQVQYNAELGKIHRRTWTTFTSGVIIPPWATEQKHYEIPKGASE